MRKSIEFYYNEFVNIFDIISGPVVKFFDEIGEPCEYNDKSVESRRKFFKELISLAVFIDFLVYSSFAFGGEKKEEQELIPEQREQVENYYTSVIAWLEGLLKKPDGEYILDP